MDKEKDRKNAKKESQHPDDDLELCLNDAEKYRMIFEYSNDIIVQVDRFGKILSVNNKLKEMLGFIPEEVIGKYFFNLGILQVKELPNIVREFKRAVSEGFIKENSGKIKDNTDKFIRILELNLRSKSGNLILAETSTTILKKDGKIEGFLINIRDITERKKTDERLKASEEKYSSLVEKCNDSIIILQDDRLKYVNSKILEVSGYNREELIGKPFFNFTTPEFKKIVIERYEKRLKGEPIPEIYNIEIILKNGLKMPVEINASRIEYEGRPASMAILRDITQRKQMELILKIQKEIASSLGVSTNVDKKLDIILNAISNIDGIDSGGIYISDPLTGDLILRAHYGFSSKFISAVATYKPDTAQWKLIQEGRPVYINHSEDRIKNSPFILEEGVRGIAVIPLNQNRSLLGSINVASHSLDEIPENTRTILETVAGQLTEVLIRISAETELKDTKNYLDTIIKSSKDSIFVVNEQGRFEFGNESFFNLSGYPEDEILGSSFMKLIHPEYHYFILKMWDEAQETDGKPYEVDIINKDGTIRSLSMSHSDVEFGGKRKYCVMAKDITDQKRMYEFLQENEEKFKGIFDRSPVAIEIYDVDGKLIEVNKECLDLFGVVDIEQIKGFNLFEDPNIPADFRKRLLNNQSVNYESIFDFDIVKKNNLYNTKRSGQCYIDVIIIPMKKEDNLPFGYLVHISEITDRKLAEEAIRNGQERYHKILQTALDGFWVSDMERRFIDVNDSYCNIIGYSREELLRMNIRDVELMESESDITNHTQKIIENGSDRFESKHVTKDGQVVDCEISVNYLKNEGKFFVFLRDITRRKQREKILQSRNRLIEFSRSHSVDELLRKILDEIEALTGSKIGFFHFISEDQKTIQLQTWSTKTLKEMCTARGKGRHYDISEAGVWVDCFYNRNIVVHNDYSALSNRKGLPPGHAPVIREIVVPIIRADRIKAIIGIGNKSSFYDDKDAETLKLLADFGFDLVERKRIEEALIESQIRLQSVLDNSTTVFFIKDIEGRYMMINRRFEELFHVTRKTIIGKYDMDIFPLDFAERFQRHDLLALEKGEPIEVEELVPQDDGIHVYISVKFPLLTADSKPYAVCGISTDITELKRTQEESIQLLKREKAAIDEASAARKLDGLKSAFLATMSHELRTPLNSIIGFTGLMLNGLSGPITDDQEKQLLLVNHSAEHLLSLIKDILDISSIESGNFKIIISSFDIQRIIQSVINTMKPLADEKNLTLYLEDPHDEILIQSDSIRVKQILLNLIGNAIKFTKKGDIIIECKISGTQVITRIIDTGIGIRSEQFDELFKPFKQIDEGSTRTYGGSGLGLSISKKLVEILGGTISVESEYGKGSIFTFTLPLKRREYETKDSHN
ncbi:MAG: PAS domain S-box protein [Candidatus Methanoperedens sp.]|nr:PAS domain S-box protein [Candidatus Methanoperedens sp.]